MTLESLKQAIREADDLSDLKKLVGPSEEDNEAARVRIERLDWLDSKRGDGNLPSHLQHEWDYLMQGQNAFEREYC